MDIQYVYTKKRADFGRQVVFSDRPVEIITDIQPNPELIKEFVAKNPVHVGIQNTKEFSEHWVNTTRFETENRGVNHFEGGWPKDINPLESEQTLRFRKKTEKEEIYSRTVSALGRFIQQTIRQNNAIDIYEHYFQNVESDVVTEAPFVRTINVFRDPHETPRTVNHISWHSDGAHKIAASYCNLEFQSINDRTIVNSYIWDIENSTKPDSFLKPISPLVCIEFNPKDINQLAGGYHNGQVCIFDTRKGSTPVEQSLIENSHRDPVYRTVWLQSKSGTEFFSASTDGKVIWWDTRKLIEPIETLTLDLDLNTNKEPGALLGAMSIDYDPITPSRFMVGTEQGRILVCNRKGKSDTEKISSIFQGHWGPVYSVQRHPQFPKIFLSVGDWTARLWHEDIKDECIIRTRSGIFALTDGQWSPTRPSLFFTTTMNGTLDVWDVLFKQHEPTLSISITDEPLHCLKVMESHGRLVACGSQDGSITLIEVSNNLRLPGKSEKLLMSGMIDRETRRARATDETDEIKPKSRGSSANQSKKKVPKKKIEEDRSRLGWGSPVDIEKAEKDFWRMIEEEKRRNDRPT